MMPYEVGKTFIIRVPLLSIETYKELCSEKDNDAFIRKCYANDVLMESIAMESPESLEDMVIRQMEIETLQKAMQTLSEIQRERLHLYFFEGMTTREIADRQGTNQNAVWKSIQSGVAVLRRFF